MDELPRFGRFKLLKMLDSGAIAETFVARLLSEDKTGGELIIKRIYKVLSGDEGVIEMLRREAQVTASLNHPALSKVFELGQTSDGEHYVAREYSWGENLRRVAERGMTAGRFLTNELAVGIVREIVDALDYVHRRTDSSNTPLDLVFQDLSPSNIVLGYDGRVRLLDFGVSLSYLKSLSDARHIHLKSKFAFQSPEQAQGLAVDHRSDLFAVGTLLYEFTTRKRLFKANDELTILKQIVDSEVKPPSQWIKSFPPELERIILKALEKSPDQRYQSAAKLGEDLDAFLKTSGFAPSKETMAQYMRGIFPDNIASLEELLGEGYRGPADWLIASFRSRRDSEPVVKAKEKPEVVSHDAKTPAPKLPPIPPPMPEPVLEPSLVMEETNKPNPAEPSSQPELEDLTPTEAPAPMVGPPSARLDANLGSGPFPVVTDPEADTEVKRVSHQLRRAHLDDFEEAAESSQRIMWLLGIIMLGVIVFIFWYGSKYEWPWEGIGENIEALPDAPPRDPLETPDLVLVDIGTTPEGAAVAINGIISTHRTPATYGLVPSHPNTIGFYLDGFETYTFDYQLRDEGADPIDISLVEITQPLDWIPPEPDPTADVVEPMVWEPPRARINVETEPPGATILLNGDVACAAAPCEFEASAEQEQHLTARLAGHYDTATVVVAPEHGTKWVEIELLPVHDERFYVQLLVESAPDDADVSINGEYAGFTSIEDLFPIDEIQRVEVTLDEYEPWARTFYPGVGRFQIRVLLDEIRYEPSMVTIVIVDPTLEMDGTVIYVDSAEVGVNLLQNYVLDSGSHELVISYTPPRETGLPRRRTETSLTIPSGTHVIERYGWIDSGEGFDWSLIEHIEETIPENFEELEQP